MQELKTETDEHRKSHTCQRVHLVVLVTTQCTCVLFFFSIELELKLILSSTVVKRPLSPPSCLNEKYPLCGIHYKFTLKNEALVRILIYQWYCHL